MNNYNFWESYLKNLKNKLEKLCLEKKELYIDLHMHSNYSADGKQTLKEILISTKEKGFDVIAITDHDNVNVYDELYELLNDDIDMPLVMPGIEFTIDNYCYGNQCHLLQLFINPKDQVILKNVEKNYQSSFLRSKKQFIRLKENKAIEELVKNNKIKLSYEEYIKYLSKNELIPEYNTLCDYLMIKFKEKSITNFTILSLLEKYNKYDIYEDRKAYKDNRFKELRKKYEKNNINDYNSRFLLSMLAVREVDDDWWDSPSSGSLSVNSYGQLKLEDLNNKYKIFFAHPRYDKLDVVKIMINNKKNIIGVEKNIRNHNPNHYLLEDFAKENKLLMILGSDSHDNKQTYYQDMNFYKISKEDFMNVIRGI